MASSDVDGRRAFRRSDLALLRHVFSGALPRKPPRHLQLQRETKEAAKQHYRGEHAHILEYWSDDDGSDDIARDEQFEPEQQRPRKAHAVGRVASLRRSSACR